ncbi:MAG: SDR family NAD(P)-dependent oxidoreductase [Sphingobacteriales bacterium]|nr:SDR family NAD(P)-dependent oxidoreductase [Sphingobacteriales bacterium]
MGIEVNFEGKIALITGASSGLGARFAKILAQAGAQVVLASRRIERLKELRAEIEADGGAAHVVSLDVTDYASIKSAIAHAETEAGPIDINSADSLALIALPGIGNKLAKRITTFRDKLGGFYTTVQVSETFGLPDSTYQKIKTKLIITTGPKQLNINTATLDELKNHPYIHYQIANSIIQYRKQHGNFTAVIDIKNSMLITEEIFNKISPYLKVN